MGIHSPQLTQTTTLIPTPTPTQYTSLHLSPILHMLYPRLLGKLILNKTLSKDTKQPYPHYF